MSMDIAQLLHGQNTLNSLLSKIQILQKENDGKKLNMKELEKSVNDLEPYSKMDNLIISEFNRITVFPFAGGRSLIWDATCCDT